MMTLAIAGDVSMGVACTQPPRNPLIELLIKLARILNQRGEP